MKISKNIIIGAVIGLGALIAIIGLRKFVFKSNKDKVKSIIPDAQGIDTSSVVIAESEKSEFPIKYGSKGDKVKELQRFLNYGLQQKGKPVLMIDGIWGSATDRAFKDLNKNVDNINESAYKVIKAYLMKKEMLGGAISGGARK